MCAMKATRTKSGKAIDGRDAPAYAVAEAAHYLRLPAATLRSWALGRQYPTAEGGARFRPLIRPASPKPPLLSFWNLIEAHVLRSLRTEHGVSVPALRNALNYAEKELGIERLLLRPDLRTNAGSVFLEKYGALIELSASGQLAMRRVLQEHLKRIEWDGSKFPVQLYPFLPAGEAEKERPIVIDARVAFGRPVLASKSISTRAIADRIDAGEPVADVAADYGLDASEIEQAAVYERAA
jgi:uncharacterized protein (DUF433 family)